VRAGRHSSLSRAGVELRRVEASSSFQPCKIDPSMSVDEALQHFPRLCKILLPSVRRSFLDQSCNLFRVRDVDGVTRAWNLDLVAVGSCGIPALKLGTDGSVASSYQHPAWFVSHAAVVITPLKLSALFSTCDRAMKAACSAGKSAAKYSWNCPGSR
jgi:hypothetical protein